MKKQNSTGNYLTLKYCFPGIRVLDGVLVSTEWTLRVKIAAIAVTDGSKSVDQIQMDGNMAYQKIYYWLETYMPGVLITGVDNEVGMIVSQTAQNNFMHTPGEPTDDLLVQLLFSKLTAIIGDDLKILEVNVESKDMSASYTFNGQYSLPKTVKEYIADKPSLHRKPWWLRDDGFAFEFTKERNMKEPLAELYADIVDPLREYEAMIYEVVAEVESENNEPAAIIKTDKWKPKTV